MRQIKKEREERESPWKMHLSIDMSSAKMHLPSCGK